jgi:hypothetical protein
LTVPEQSTLDAADLQVISAEAKAIGLTQDEAAALVGVRHAAVQAAMAQLLADAQADPEIGGAHFDATVATAKVGMEWLFPKAEDRALVTGWFDKTGLGNHKVFLAAMARLGRARKEDGPLVSGNPPEPAVPFHDKFYAKKA